MRTRASILLLAVLLAACGNGSDTQTGAHSMEPTMAPTVAPTVEPSGEPPGARPVPRTLTPADGGGTFTMRVGDTSSLVVEDPSVADPRVEGTSVEVIGVDNIQASGQREWELRALEPGQTVLHGPAPQPYTITLVVSG